MYDKVLAKEVLNQILNSSNTIVKRCTSIENADDFVCNEIGLEKLDAICMQLIAIGESIKNLDKITNRSLFKRYPQIEWKKAKGMRDIITHHYFDLNAELTPIHPAPFPRHPPRLSAQAGNHRRASARTGPRFAIRVCSPIINTKMMIKITYLSPKICYTDKLQQTTRMFHRPQPYEFQWVLSITPWR